MKKYLVYSFVIVICMSFIDCNKKKSDKLLKFEPIFSTNSDLSSIDSVTVIRYKDGQILNNSKTKFKYKFSMDTVFIKRGDPRRWRFVLKDSLVQGFDYKLIIRQKEYHLKGIDYDTMFVGNSIFYRTKSYMINGKKHSLNYPLYYIDE